MILFGSLTSPFARKCRITALECGVDNRVTFEIVNVMDTDTPNPNPLRLVPCLQTDEGDIIADSRVICEFLMAQGTPLPAATTWRDKVLVALSDGLMDRAVDLTLELRRPENLRSQDWQNRRIAAIRATLRELEDRAPDYFTPGAIALTCALAYLDLRFDDLNWRNGHDTLAAWFDTQAQRPSVVATEPPA